MYTKDLTGEQKAQLDQKMKENAAKVRFGLFLFRRYEGPAFVQPRERKKERFLQYENCVRIFTLLIKDTALRFEGKGEGDAKFRLKGL